MSEPNIGIGDNTYKSFLPTNVEKFIQEVASFQREHQRTFCYKDFETQYSHSYFRKLISTAIKAGKIAIIKPRTNPAFYRVKGIALPCKKDLIILDKTDERAKAIMNHFKIIGCKEPAIHDIRLLAYAEGIHSACIAKGYAAIEPSKDIKLINNELDAWRSVQVIVHNNDKISIIFSCSNRPIACNTIEIMKWLIVLGKIQARIQTMTGVQIPDADLWQFRSYHLNQDCDMGVNLPAGVVVTVRDLSGALIQVYTKNLPNEDRPVLRTEKQVTAKESKPVWQKAIELMQGGN